MNGGEKSNKQQQQRQQQKQMIICDSGCNLNRWTKLMTTIGTALNPYAKQTVNYTFEKQKHKQNSYTRELNRYTMHDRKHFEWIKWKINHRKKRGEISVSARSRLCPICVSYVCVLSNDLFGIAVKFNASHNIAYMREHRLNSSEIDEKTQKAASRLTSHIRYTRHIPDTPEMIILKLAIAQNVSYNI